MHNCSASLSIRFSMRINANNHNMENCSLMSTNHYTALRWTTFGSPSSCGQFNFTPQNFPFSHNMRALLQLPLRNGSQKLISGHEAHPQNCPCWQFSPLSYWSGAALAYANQLGTCFVVIMQLCCCGAPACKPDHWVVTLRSRPPRFATGWFGW